MEVPTTGMPYPLACDRVLTVVSDCWVEGLRRKLQGRFLHITDMHPDPYYKTEASEKSACHRMKPKRAKRRSGYYGMPYR